ncbi:DUF421 domain-containing protein [Robertmurraya korlensis]|uniref:DUF421 domain-containing protein n=1 Tax=Robertmurraya korlensis TaxID=519977 RepID=UPI0008244BDB|nr:DUF421 domain-containing protein [Robertmurraya korlensis]
MNHYFTVGIELIVGFVVLFLLAKLLGKTQLSQITPFDFISALILGELVGNAIYDHETSWVEILFSTAVWGGLIFLVEIITQKFKSTRKSLEGEPNIVIHNGIIKYQTLKKAKLDINQLQALVRQQGYFSLQEVQFAILETNGMVSVLPKSQNRPPTLDDLNIKAEQPSIPVTLIIDGEVLSGNLHEAGLDEQWLKEELSKQNFHSFEKVLYAEWKKNQGLFAMSYQ